MPDDTPTVLSFALKWRFWGGGPDEDIFVEFGLTPRQFFVRLQEILRNRRYVAILGVSDTAYVQLQTICRMRLAATTRRSPFAEAAPQISSPGLGLVNTARKFESRAQ